MEKYFKKATLDEWRQKNADLLQFIKDNATILEYRFVTVPIDLYLQDYFLSKAEIEQLISYIKRFDIIKNYSIDYLAKQDLDAKSFTLLGMMRSSMQKVNYEFDFEEVKYGYDEKIRLNSLELFCKFNEDLIVDDDAGEDIIIWVTKTADDWFWANIKYGNVYCCDGFFGFLKLLESIFRRDI